MIKIGEFNSLKIVRKAEFGYFLDAGTGKTSDDILLPIKSAEGDLDIGDEIDVFIYRDSKDRLISTMKKPLAQVGQLAYLKVVSKTKIGSFINFGLERDIFVPLKEENYKIEQGKSYLFYIYLDKTGRLAATTFIDRYLSDTNSFNVGDEVEGIVYGFQTNGSVMVAVQDTYRGVILNNEYFSSLEPGKKLNLRVKKYYEDGKLGLTPRKKAVDEKNELEEKIMEYLKKNNGFMPYNDKSSPQDIKNQFQQSKNYFKNALGGLMKKGLIEQDEKGTKIK